MSHPAAEKNYYAILGADEDADADEIERRYKRLATQHHPDRGGDEEAMKALNEAYQVLGNEASRRAYDAGRGRDFDAPVAPIHVTPSARADAFGGRVVGALLCLGVGLALLLLVRFHYIWFLWPLGILAAFVALLGVWMAHAALSFARAGFAPGHLARRFVWAQEAAFWSTVAAGAYGVYLLMSAM